MPPPPYPGAVGGFGVDTSPYAGDWSAGADMGWGHLDPTQGGTLTAPLPPGVYPTPGGGTVELTPAGDVLVDGQPFNPSDPWPGSEPLEPTVGAPIYDPTPGAGGEGYPEPYVPAPSQPEPRGTVQEGQIVAPESGPSGPATHPSSGWSILERIAGGALGRLARRIAGEAVGGPIGAIIQEIITPTELPPEPDVRELTPITLPRSVARVPGASGPATAVGHGAVATAPQPAPSRPPPTPDAGVKPWQFDTPTPSPRSSVPSPTPTAPAPSRSEPPTPSLPSTTAQPPVTSPQPAPRSPTQASSSPTPSPLWQLYPSLPFGQLLRAGAPGSAIPATPTSSPVPIPGATASAEPLPTPQPASSSAAPPLTPFNAASVESPMPEGESCETPKQQKQRRQQRRENCQRFVTITIPKHRRRVCVAEAAHHLGKHLGKELGRAITDKLGITKPKRERKNAKPAKLRVSKKGSVSYGGYGVSLPKQMRPPSPFGVPKL